MRPPPLRVAAALLASVLGTAMGHAVVYSLAPLSHVGTAALESAGHTHHPLPSEALPVVLLVATALYALGTRPRRGPGGRYALARPLAAVQCSGFLALEAVERLLALGTAATLLSEPVILLGLAVQVVVAVAVAGLLTVGADMAHDTANHRRTRRPAPPMDERPRVLHVVPAAVRPGRHGLSFRGPPLLA